MRSATEATALSEIRAAIAESPDLRPRIPPDLVEPSTRFREDLGFDSLGLMSLAFALQELHPTLDETEIAGWKLVGDCIRTVVSTTEAAAG